MSQATIKSYVCQKCGEFDAIHAKADSVQLRCQWCGSAVKNKTAKQAVDSIVRVTTKDRRYIKRLKKLGASNYEISMALAIPEESVAMYE